MELVYLWVEEYKNIKEQGFNFSSKFDCDYDEDKNELTIKESDDYISDFFGDNINVTAIVGKNGSGKSSVLECLSSGGNCFSVYIEKNEIHICNDINNLLKFSNVFFNNEEVHSHILSDDKRLGYKIFIHHSEIKSKGKFADNRDLLNGAFNVPDKQIEESKKYQKTLCTVTKRGDSKTVLNSCIKEDKSFLLEYIKRPLFDNNIFNINFIGFKWEFALGNYAEYILKVLKSTNIRNRYTTDTDDFISKNKVIDTFVLIYLLESVEINKRKYMSVQNEEEFQLYKKNLLENKIEESDKKTCKYIILFLKYILSIEDEREIRDLVSDIHITEPDVEQSIRINVDFNKEALNEKNIEFVLNVLVQKPFILQFKDFKKGIEYDYLSSGEQELIFILFKIHDILHQCKIGLFDKKETIYGYGTNRPNYKAEVFKQECKIIYLLLDEPTNHFHPEWQKNFINILVGNLKTHTNIKFYIILTTHSPFQLSDIPKQNIVFLDKDENGKCKVVNGLKEKKQTFGANIHTLLSDSFFMEDGLMGEFAKGKINEIKKLYELIQNEKIQKRLEKEKIKELAQKSFNRRKKRLWQIQSIIGEPFLKTVSKNYLDEVEIILFDDKAKEMAIERFVKEFDKDDIMRVLNGKA